MTDYNENNSMMNRERFKLYSQELFKCIDNQIIMNEKLWEYFLIDYGVQEEAIRVVKNKWNEDCFQNLYIIDQMLCEYEKIPIIIYFKLVNLILSNKQLARCRISASDNTFLEKILYVNNIQILESKEFIFDEIESGYHNHSIYDLRYLILRNESFDEMEKETLIEEYDQDEYDKLIETIEYDIVNKSLKNGEPVLLSSEVLFEDIDVVELHLNSQALLNDVRFVRKLISIRKPSWFNEKVKKKCN